MGEPGDQPSVTSHRAAGPWPDGGCLGASRTGPDRGSGSAAWDDAGGPRSGTWIRRCGRRAARPIWPQPIGTQNEVEIEMEMDVREFLIGGL